MKPFIDFSFIQNWYEANKFSEEELKLLKTVSDFSLSCDDVSEDTFENDIVKPLLNLHPQGIITSDDYTVRFDTRATDFIRMMSEYFDDDDTLFVTSNNEHINAQTLFKDIKNLHIIDADTVIHNFDTFSLIEKCKQYKRVFFYIIGTEISRGKIVPNTWFKHIRNALSGHDLVICLDDVQGMFVIPRDYSLFDYIIGTAHSLIPSYDMGICIQRKDSHIFGKQLYHTAKEYLKILPILLTRLNALYSFTTVMQQAFSLYLAQPEGRLFYDSAPHIFSIVIGDDRNTVRFTKREQARIEQGRVVYIEGVRDDCDYQYVRFRGQELLQVSLEEIKNKTDYLERVFDERLNF